MTAPSPSIRLQKLAQFKLMLRQYFKGLLRYLPFVMVGAMAALVHYCVAMIAYYWVGGFNASNSNWLGFIGAFPVSYIGHRVWTFNTTAQRHRWALIKFFAVALMSFQANQLLVWIGLLFTPLPFWLVLGLVMLIVAVMTYLLSKWWVFQTKPSTRTYD